MFISDIGLQFLCVCVCVCVMIIYVLVKCIPDLIRESPFKNASGWFSQVLLRFCALH